MLRRGYIVDVGKNKDKDTYYIQVAYSMIDPDKRAQELGSFNKLDDGYKKVVITMDDDPFAILENGHMKINTIDFLLNEKALEEV